MGKPLVFGLITVLAFTFSSAVQAQRGGAVSGGAHALAPAHAAAPARIGSAPRSGHVFTNVRLNGKHSSPRRLGIGSGPRTLYGSTSSVSRSSLPALGGLGFDCENLGCSSRNLGVEALIDPATAANLALAARFHRLGNLTGAYLLTGGYGGVPIGYDEPESDYQDQDAGPAPAPQQPQIIVIQQPAPAARPAEAESAPAAEAPLPDVGDFTLLLKNGGEISAVAFTRRNDQLVYITREGNRRTVRVADIDAAATIKLNEDRGTPLKLSI